MIVCLADMRATFAVQVYTVYELYINVHKLTYCIKLHSIRTYLQDIQHIHIVHTGSLNYNLNHCIHIHVHTVCIQIFAGLYFREFRESMGVREIFLCIRYTFAAAGSHS